MTGSVRAEILRSGTTCKQSNDIGRTRDAMSAAGLRVDGSAGRKANHQHRRKDEGQDAE